MADIHWTYDSTVAAGDDLYQGDILVRTVELDDLLQKHFTHFKDQKYLGFLVVTQSCDLVRRNQKECKAEHICLAAIRDLGQLVPAIVEQIAGAAIKGFYRENARFLAVGALRKLVNQNEQSRGMFYLHPGPVTTDGQRKIATPSVAMLRVTIAVRRQHYEQLQRARIGRLDKEFRNKLGWLCGNLYSRIDTPDWDEVTNSSGTATRLAKSLLNCISPDCWIPQEWVEAAEEAGAQFDDLAPDAARELLKSHAPPAPHLLALEDVRNSAALVRAIEIAAAFREGALADPVLKEQFSEHVRALIAGATGVELENLADVAVQIEKLRMAAVPKLSTTLRGLIQDGEGSDEFRVNMEESRLSLVQNAFQRTASIAVPGFDGDLENFCAEEPLLNAQLSSGFATLAQTFIEGHDGRIPIDVLLKRLETDPDFREHFGQPSRADLLEDE